MLNSVTPQIGVSLQIRDQFLFGAAGIEPVAHVFFVSEIRQSDDVDRLRHFQERGRGSALFSRPALSLSSNM